MAQVTDPARARSVATEIVTLLRSGGFLAYFAGGCVRDELLGLHPSDYDVATSATPRQIEGLLKQPRFATHFVGEAFGVTLVKVDGIPVEVATFRSDGTYTDKRRPDSVVFSTPHEDAQRRDFTINALFLDPLSAVRTPVWGQKFLARGQATVAGEVIDLVGGIADLKAGLIRAVGDAHARLKEDDLRALRAVRFAARYGFKIEGLTAQAIIQHAGDLAGVSRERIGEELRRMLLGRTGETRIAAAQLLATLGLDLPVFGPVIDADSPITKRRQTEGNSEGSSGGNGEQSSWPALAAVGLDAGLGTLLAALMVDRQFGSKPCWWAGAVEHWRRGLCLSNDELVALVGTLESLWQLQHEWGGATVSGQKRMAAKACFGSTMEVLGGISPAEAAEVRKRVAELEIIGPGIHPLPILGGAELIAAGYKPGPDFKRMLDMVYDAQLEGQICDLAGAMELVQRRRI